MSTDPKRQSSYPNRLNALVVSLLLVAILSGSLLVVSSSTAVADSLSGSAFEQETSVLLPLVITPGSQALSGRVLKNGIPLEGKRIEVVNNTDPSNEFFAAVVTTDSQGVWRADVDTDIPYEIRGFGDTGANELHEWVWYPTPSTGGEIELPVIDVYYAGLIQPADGTVAKLGEGAIIQFKWSAHPEANDYTVFLRDWPLVVWRSSATNSLETSLGAFVPSGDYFWHVGMSLNSGWWVWSRERTLKIESIAPKTTLSGRVLKNGAPLAGKRIEVVLNPSTPNETFAAVVSTDSQGIWTAPVDTSEAYEIRGYGNMNENEFQEWVWASTPISSESVTLPDADVYYAGLVSPEDGAAVQLGSGQSVTFEWLPRVGVRFYRLFIRDYDNWANRVWTSQNLADTQFTVSDDLPVDQYMWHVGMALDSGWWCWSQYRELNVE